MLVLYDPLRQTDVPTHCVATIGNFDGMHVGHQEIVRGVVRRARELNGPSVMVTFHPHPLAIVAPARLPPQILTMAQKEEILAAMGLDALLVIPFTPEFSRWSAERFIHDFMVKKLQVREVHIGVDFTFGAGREGNLEKLKGFGQRWDFHVVGVEDVRVRGIRVSSSLIRDALRKGAVQVAELGLGRPYSIDGTVATGRRLGRKIGVPTVNIDLANELFPGSGVYVTTTRFGSFGRNFESVTNIGVRPTLYENYAMIIESHILDFDSNVYGDSVRLYFHRLLRREQKFRSAVELKEQIRDDIERTRQYFTRHPLDPAVQVVNASS